MSKLNLLSLKYLTVEQVFLTHYPMTNHTVSLKTIELKGLFLQLNHEVDHANMFKYIQ